MLFRSDFYACSPYKFLGPHLGALAASPALLETLHPDKLLPSSNAVPDRFELGTLPYESLAGTTAAVDFLANLIPGEGSRRSRLTVSIPAMHAHELALRDRLESGLRSIPAITLHGCGAKNRTPTILFTVEGKTPREIHEHLAKSNINVPASSFYALECAHHLGLGEAGAARAGIAPYTNESDVDRLLTALG